MIRFRGWVMAAACLAVLGGCAYPAGSYDYRGYQVMGEQSVRFGVVDSVRPVRINPGDTGVGTAGGAVLGGLAGSTVGGQSRPAQQAGSPPGARARAQCVTRVTPRPESTRTRSPGRKASSASCTTEM
jgi:outer membrane lipoprotein SlyB